MPLRAVEGCGDKVERSKQGPNAKMAIEIAQRFIPQPIPGPGVLADRTQGAYEVSRRSADRREDERQGSAPETPDERRQNDIILKLREKSPYLPAADLDREK